MMDDLDTPELRRLVTKMVKIDAWLTKHGPTHPKFAERQDVWMQTERKYRRTYDAERRNRIIAELKAKEDRGYEQKSLV